MAAFDEPDAHEDVPRPRSTRAGSSEWLAAEWEHFRHRYPDWDLTRMLLVATALVAVGGMAWTVLAAGSGSGSQAPLAVQGAASSTSLVLGPYEPNPTSATTTSVAPSTVTVDVEGAVHAPGIVHVGASGRVADAIAAAGGATSDADVVRINRAAPIVDGQRIYVPRVGEDQPPSVIGPDVGAPDAPGAATPAPDALVDLNTATAEELDALPGVGPATAQAIIDHRSTNGPFVSVDDLLDVRGIGEAKLADLRDKVTV